MSKTTWPWAQSDIITSFSLCVLVQLLLAKLATSFSGTGDKLQDMKLVGFDVKSRVPAAEPNESNSKQKPNS